MGVAEVWNSRTLTLLGEEAVGRLARARVLVAGVGGVGGYAAEMLARSGVGHLTLVDADNVAISNINRQIIATSDAVGESKVRLFADRFRAINPEIDVRPIQEYLDADNIPALLDREFDYVIDAIDTVAPKMTLILECLRRGIPIISSMGAGGRLDPSKVGYFDISETRDDGLARVVRQRLRKAGIRRGLTVVASTERPERHSVIPLDERNKRSSFGTIATIPAMFGIFLSSKVIDEICWK